MRISVAEKPFAPKKKVDRARGRSLSFDGLKNTDQDETDTLDG